MDPSETINCQTDGFDGKLSARQTQVLLLFGQGLSRDEIARKLGVRYYTVSEHLKKIYRRLGVHNRAAAMALVYKKGWLRMNPESIKQMSDSVAGQSGGKSRSLFSLECCPGGGCPLETGMA